ncbi:circadian locomoter output cycles protein kaput-like isoform X2 [Phymastichus coffea]|uniref:circadian locomoter output cycles protein kaput-like isoform X2 n=1 Tax=Phymastichus coffea TaxID=108790 RepID=UPI00273A9FB2|nr:circadian locomoter output cycles protein kaput-like isoform X2 [Phymastichus coffea]
MMTEASCVSSHPARGASMWQATQQYQYGVPPQRLYDEPYVQQSTFLYPQFPPPQSQPVVASSPSMYYYNLPHQQHHQQPPQPAPQPPPPQPPPPPPPPPQQQPKASPQPRPERSSTPSAAELASASNPRASRNAAEKHRRDNLNTQIQAMATLVPAVSSGGSRKRDKISILRLAANYIRMHYTLGRPSGEFLPSKYSDIDLEDRLLEDLAGNLSFLLVLTTSGKIIYVSRHVEKHLGHEQTDLMGESLFNYVYEDDKDELKRQLTPDTSLLPALVSSSDSVEDNSNSSSDDSATYQPDYRQFRSQRRVFNVRMSVRTNSRREAVHYEYIQLSGVLKLSSERMLQEQANGGKAKKLSNLTSNDIIFTGTARLLQRKSVSELPYLVHNRNEYYTRHLVDGRIIFCDHRISIVAGYMAQEVSGTSAFKFMHKDDVRWTIVALRHSKCPRYSRAPSASGLLTTHPRRLVAVYDHGTPYGSSCYRLIAKTGQYIYLRTHGYLEFDEETKNVSSFICINTLTSQEEGEELIAEMKKRYSATINGSRAIQGNDSGFIIIQQESDTECTSTMSIAPTMDEPDQLEQAINELVSDLPATVNNEAPCPDELFSRAMFYSQKLPPPSVHANQAGIKDVDNIYFGKGGKGGKGKAAGKATGKGKGKQSPSACTSADSPTDYPARHGERVSSVGEKRIPELEDPTSPTIAVKPTALTTDKASASTNPSESKTYSESLTVEDDLSTNATASIDTSDAAASYNLQTNLVTDYVQPSTPYDSNLQQVNLKRSYDDEDEQVTSKKKGTENCVTVELVNVNDFVNGEISFPAYIEVQSTSLRADLQDVPATFQQIDTDSIALASTDDSFIELKEFSDELNPSIPNNPEVIKLLTNLPQTITLEGTGEEVNICQYPTSDLRD